jgi:hypothetical protein
MPHRTITVALAFPGSRCEPEGRVSQLEILRHHRGQNRWHTFSLYSQAGLVVWGQVFDDACQIALNELTAIRRLL